MSEPSTIRAADTNGFESSRKRIKLSEAITIDSDDDEEPTVIRTRDRPRKSQVQSHSRRTIRCRVRQHNLERKPVFYPYFLNRLDKVWELRRHESVCRVRLAWERGYLNRQPTHEDVYEQMMRDLSRGDPQGLDMWIRAVWGSETEYGDESQLVMSSGVRDFDTTDAMYTRGVLVGTETTKTSPYQHQTRSHLSHVAPRLLGELEVYNNEASQNCLQSTSWHKPQTTCSQNKSKTAAQPSNAFGTTSNPGLFGSLGIPHNMIAAEMLQIQTQSRSRIEYRPPSQAAQSASTANSSRQARQHDTGTRESEHRSRRRRPRSGFFRSGSAPTSTLISESKSKSGSESGSMSRSRSGPICVNHDLNVRGNSSSRGAVRGELKKETDLPERDSPARSSDSTVSLSSSQQ